MPAWLVSIIISTAVALGKVGLQWLVTKFPGLPQPIIDAVTAILSGFADTKTQQKALVADAKMQAVAAVCPGGVCPAPQKLPEAPAPSGPIAKPAANKTAPKKKG